MLKYLIVLLDDTSPSFCHYNNEKTERRLIEYDTLKNGLIWAMKENLMVQFVYPDYELSKDYLDLIDSIDHIDIKNSSTKADVSVFEGLKSLQQLKLSVYPHPILRLSKNEMFSSTTEIQEILKLQPSMNIVLTDIETYNEDDFKAYQSFLDKLSESVIDKMKTNQPVNINLLTDRLYITSMNNCNSGDESITLAPDGKFYICPAFYFDDKENVGNSQEGVSIPNNQLYKLSHAPICRNCDAFQCKRCVWLNQKTTLEVNTPGHEQCVLAHLERNTSRNLLERLKKHKLVSNDISIPEIDYLDPIDKIIR